jgi:hypothetical protein
MDENPDTNLPISKRIGYPILWAMLAIFAYVCVSAMLFSVGMALSNHVHERAGETLWGLAIIAIMYGVPTLWATVLAFEKAFPQAAVSASGPSRWFRFRLRTLFVIVLLVSLPLAAVPYVESWETERIEVANLPCYRSNPWHDGADAPWILWFSYREHGAETIYLTRPTPEEVERVRRLFPESQVVIKP